MIKLANKNLLIFFFLLGMISQLRSNNLIDSLETQLEIEQDVDHRLKLISDLIKNTLWEDVDQAKIYIDKYRLEASQANNRSETARSYNFYGMWNFVQSDYDQAIQNYLKALPIYEELQDTFMIAMMYNNIGASYKPLHNFEQTIEYFDKAMINFESVGDKQWTSNIQYNIALEYYDQGEYQTALTMLQKVKKDYIQREDLEFLPDCYESIGNCVLNLQGASEALPFFLEALKYDHLRNNEILVWKSLCACYTELKNYDNAEKYCNLGLKNLDKIPANTIRLEILQTTSKLYKQTGRYKKASLMQDQIIELKDRIYNISKDEKLLSTIKKYESDKKDREIKMKDEQLAQKNKTQKLYNISLILAILMLICALLLMWWKIKSMGIMQEKNRIIKDQLEEKSILMKEIHHRVKNNLQIISSLLNIQSREINDVLAIEAINLSRNRVKSMALIHQNLYQKENITNIDAKDYIERLSLSIFHSYKINQENIKLATDVDELDLDVDLTIPLGLIINELVTNALKHAFPENKKGKINIELKQIENSLRLTVSDNGIGMEKEHELKSSFGLKMIRIFAKKLKATYSIENNNGSQITLLINNFKLVG